MKNNYIRFRVHQLRLAIRQLNIFSNVKEDEPEVVIAGDKLPVSLVGLGICGVVFERKLKEGRIFYASSSDYCIPQEYSKYVTIDVEHKPLFGDDYILKEEK